MWDFEVHSTRERERHTKNPRQAFPRHQIYCSSSIKRQNSNVLTVSPVNRKKPMSCLEDSLCGSHAGLDVESSDVLPVLLQQGHQEVDGQSDVGVQLICIHGHMADTGRQTQHLDKTVDKPD